MYKKIVSHDTSRKDFLVKAGLAVLVAVPAVEALYRKNYKKAMEQKIIIQGRRDIGWQISVDHLGNLYYRKMAKQDLAYNWNLAEKAKLAGNILKLNPALAGFSLGLAGLGDAALEKLNRFTATRRDFIKNMFYVSGLMYLVSCGDSSSVDDHTIIIPGTDGFDDDLGTDDATSVVTGFSGRCKDQAVDIYWNAYQGTDFAAYELYQDDQPIKEVTSINTTGAEIIGLTNGQAYLFKIRIRNTAELYSDFAVIQLTPQAADDPANPDPTIQPNTHERFLTSLDNKLQNNNILDTASIIQLGTQMPEESFNIFNEGGTIETSPAAMAQMFLRLKAYNQGHLNRLQYYFANGALTEAELDQMQDKVTFLPQTFKTMIDKNYIGNQEMFNKLLTYAYYYSKTGEKPPFTTDILLENGVLGTEHPLLLLTQAMTGGDNIARGLYWAYINQNIYNNYSRELPTKIIF